VALDVLKCVVDLGLRLSPDDRGQTIPHCRILEKRGEGGMAPACCRRSPGGAEIADERARGLPLSGFRGWIGDAKPAFWKRSTRNLLASERLLDSQRSVCLRRDQDGRKRPCVASSGDAPAPLMRCISPPSNAEKIDNPPIP
jgi:hypothetical protein